MRKFAKHARLLIASLSVIALNACGHVTVFDKEVCADLGVVGAHCAFTLANPPKRRDIEKAKWDTERIGWMCMRADDFSDAEDSVDQLCRSTNLCDYETKEKIEQFKERTASVLKKAKSARKTK